jgi:hypothetical protein
MHTQILRTFFVVCGLMHDNISDDIECSLCRFIRCPEHLIGRLCGISQQIEGHSFGDHLISESVSVMSLSIALQCIAFICKIQSIQSRLQNMRDG